MSSETRTVVTQDKQEIYYDHIQNGHESLVVIAHGFFNSKDALLLRNLAKELEADYDVLLLDFRGHGQSGGLYYWTAKEPLDLLAVLEAVRGDYERLGLVGFSLGAATSIIVASKVDWIDSVIAVSAPTEFKAIEYHFWDLDVENDILYNLIGDGRFGKGVRPGPFWLKKDKPIQCVAKVKAPILFLHGESDWLIRPSHARQLHARARGRKDLAIIKNGPHAEYLIRKNKEETVTLIRNWLAKTL